MCTFLLLLLFSVFGCCLRHRLSSSSSFVHMNYTNLYVRRCPTNIQWSVCTVWKCDFRLRYNLSLKMSTFYIVFFVVIVVVFKHYFILSSWSSLTVISVLVFILVFSFLPFKKNKNKIVLVYIFYFSNATFSFRFYFINKVKDPFRAFFRVLVFSCIFIFKHCVNYWLEIHTYIYFYITYKFSCIHCIWSNRKWEKKKKNWFIRQWNILYFGFKLAKIQIRPKKLN